MDKVGFLRSQVWLARPLRNIIGQDPREGGPYVARTAFVLKLFWILVQNSIIADQALMKAKAGVPSVLDLRMSLEGPRGPSLLSPPVQTANLRPSVGAYPRSQSESWPSGVRTRGSWDCLGGRFPSLSLTFPQVWNGRLRTGLGGAGLWAVTPEAPAPARPRRAAPWTAAAGRFLPACKVQGQR